MSLSSALLLTAIATAIVPALILRLRPPKRLVDFGLAFVAAAATLWVGVRLVQRSHHLLLFEWLHLVYLLAVVAVPLALGLWFLAAVAAASAAGVRTSPADSPWSWRSAESGAPTSSPSSYAPITSPWRSMG